MVHKSFKADLAFGPDIENEEVYQRTVVANDVRSVTSRNLTRVVNITHDSFFLLFYLEALDAFSHMARRGVAKRSQWRVHYHLQLNEACEYLYLGFIVGLEHRIARDLFDTAQTAGQRLLQAEKESGGDTMDADDAGDLFELSVTFLELVGKHATDLADPGAEMDIQGNPIRKEVPIHEDKVSFLKLSRSSEMADS